MLTVNELFSGIGAFRKALINLNVPHRIIGISEVDKFAIKSYEAIYGKTRNYGDISKVEKLDYADLWSYGFPCQDISILGKKMGIKKGETRSGLLYEVKRLLEISEKPKYLIMENVKNLLSAKFKTDFEKWLEFLEKLGYKNYYKVLNAKDYGVPQNRERVFLISSLDNTPFVFPEKQELKLTLKDLLEKEVSDKFYLTEEQVNKIKFATYHVQRDRIQEKKHCDTLLTKEVKCVQIGFYNTPTRTERVRRLTPKEYWRLMGFDDESFEKAQKVCSNHQLYRQAGNSIVVPVLEKLINKLL